MYTPNFQDKRINKRCRNAIGFTRALLSEDKPRQMSTRFIDKHFGLSSRPLSAFLRDRLLICSDDHYSMDSGKCKSYIINKSGLYDLLDLLDTKKDNDITTTINYPSVTVLDEALRWANETYHEQLTSKEFEYKEQSNRLFNPIQNIRSELRKPLLASHGLRYEYDIATAAPTLLYQYSFMTPSATGEVLETLEHYIENKAAVREKLASEAEVSGKTIKVIINALFAGAYLSKHPDTSIYKELDGDIARIEFLKQHPYLTALREDIKKMWEPIKADYPVTYYTTKSGKRRKNPFNAQAKWSVYFNLERDILEIIRDYLATTNNRVFLEHDGFTSTKPVDLTDLTQLIKNCTGFDLTIEGKVNDS